MGFFFFLYFTRYNFTALERATENFNIQHGSQHQIISNVIFTEGGLSPYVSQKVIGYDSKISELIVTPCKKSLTLLLAC